MKRLLLAAALLVSSAAQATTVFPPVCTPNAPELIQTFKEDRSSNVVMSLAVKDVRAGDWFMVTAGMEATGTNSQFVDFSRAVLMGDTASAVSPANGGAWVSERTDENLDPATGWLCTIFGLCTDHHNDPQIPGMVTATKDMPSAYFNFIATGATDPDQPNYTVKVEHGYGKMCVLQFRKD